jgi:hypothetical protein
MPTQRAPAQACPGQQQWPAVSAETSCPVGQSLTFLRSGGGFDGSGGGVVGAVAVGGGACLGGQHPRASRMRMEHDVSQPCAPTSSAQPQVVPSVSNPQMKYEILISVRSESGVSFSWHSLRLHT